MFDVMARPVNSAFIVAPEKTEAFLKHRTDAELRRQVLERGRKLQRQMEKIKDERK